MGTINFNNTNGILNFGSSSGQVYLTPGEYQWAPISPSYIYKTPLYSQATDPIASSDNEGEI